MGKSLSSQVVIGAGPRQEFIAWVPVSVLDSRFPHRAIQLARRAICDWYSGEVSETTPRYQYVEYFRKNVVEVPSDREGYLKFAERVID